MARGCIVLLDDDQEIRTLLSRYCLKLGFQPVAFAEPRHFSARQDVQADRVRAVVTDIFMPGRNGIDVIQEVRAVAPEVKTIAISGGWSTGAKEEALRAAEICKADAVLAKPFTLSDFTQALDSAGVRA